MPLTWTDLVKVEEENALGILKHPVESKAQGCWTCVENAVQKCG